MIASQIIIEYLREIGFPVAGKDNPALREKLYREKIKSLEEILKKPKLTAFERRTYLEQKIRIIHHHGQFTLADYRRALSSLTGSK